MTLCQTLHHNHNQKTHPILPPKAQRDSIMLSSLWVQEKVCVGGPHLCTMALSLLRGHDEIGHNYKGAVPLEVKGRGVMERTGKTLPRKGAGAHLTPSRHHVPS